MSDSLFELRNPLKSLRIKLSGEFIRIGRAPDNTVVLQDPAISRYHLNLYVRENVLIVEDAGSKTGFYVNGTLHKEPVELNYGDRIRIGSEEYILTRPGQSIHDTPEPGQNKSSVRVENSFGESSDDDQKRKRIHIYAVAAILILVLVATLKEEPVEPEKVVSITAEEIEKSLKTDAFKQVKPANKSLQEIEAEGKFAEGLRDYHNGLYSRAIYYFSEALTLNPNMEDASDYLQFAQARLKTQIQALMRDGQRSFAILQYRRAKSQFTEVLTILSEQIPGYWQRNLQKTLAAKENERKPAQEETVLDIPCEKTKEESICKLAVELVKQSRTALGEEDTLK